MKAFVTGSAGFIGYHLSKALLAQGWEVAGYDGLTDYYDPKLKHDRLSQLIEHPGFTFTHGRLEDEEALERAWRNCSPSVVFHLAAQAGVRYSIEAPREYVSANIIGTHNILELARAHPVNHLMLASTSSAYGANESVPFTETDKADWQISLYAATKKATENISHSYAHLFDIPTTCFRFFTVYGPWGRPDMALFKFVKAMKSGTAIEIYGEGRMSRDFTYIDDLVSSMIALSGEAPSSSALATSPVAPHRVVNIAGGEPVELMEFIRSIEKAMGFEAKKNFLPMQPGDMIRTYSDSSLLVELIGGSPQTPVEEGVARFVEWYEQYYRS